jgi:pyruvate,orthophosphate dikinase
VNDFAPLFIATPGADAELTPEIAGGKAAELWRMSQLGLNVPPAFVLPTTLCAAVNRCEPQALEAMEQGLRDGIARLEEVTQKRFGDSRAPLLVSVRSGAAQSMPGMLDTILDVGLNAASLQGLISLTGNPRLAWDSYRRFTQMFAEVVQGAPASVFEARLAEMVHNEAVSDEAELDGEALERLTHGFQEAAFAATGQAIPADPMAQLAAAARAVFHSWESARAKEYRRLNDLEDLAGTAVTVQAMVFGNAGSKSGAGVAFSRNPATGEKALYADFLPNAQGEDVVAGRRMPGGVSLLAERLPEVADELAKGAAKLEAEFHDVQDIEFTVEEGRLFFLQTRSAKRTPRAALRVLVDFVNEGVLDRETALKRAESIDLEKARLTRFADECKPLATAISAAPGVASGRVAFSTAKAQALAVDGTSVILVRHDTSTEDVAGFAVAAGILTAAGGRTAHAAVVARQLGKACLVGCKALQIAEDGHRATLAGEKLGEGDWLSLDGESGAVTMGKREIIAELPEAEMAALESWRGAKAN